MSRDSYNLIGDSTKRSAERPPAKKSRSAERQSRSDKKDVVITLATVRDRAIGLLARREHSRHELREKLRQRELPADLIDAALDELVQRNLLSEDRFAEAFVRSRISRGYGEMKIRAELQSRGVSGDITDLAVEAADVNWKVNATAALKKKYLHKINEEDMRNRQLRGKMQRFLQNRGYNSDQIISAVNRFSDFLAASTEQGIE